MKQRKIIVGMKFGRLTVVSKSNSICAGKNIKRYHGTWLCKCDCGNEKVVKTINLNRGDTTSCGCLIGQYGKSLKPGDKRNNLTVISYKKGKWLCHCICGNITEVSTDKLNSGNTKSCGCIKTEISSKKAYKLIEGRRKYTPYIASARRVWKNIYSRKDDSIDFDTFLKYSQSNCFYCGIEPSNKYNFFNAASSRGSQKAKAEGLFIYNGIDRIDSEGHHTIDNIVTCCKLCNRAKNDRSIDNFLLWANRLQVSNLAWNMVNIEFPDKPLSTSINSIFYLYKKDTNLSVEEFYSISQLNCQYCNSVPSNFFNRGISDQKASIKTKRAGSFYYNGLDRIDSKLTHSKDNIVPCCYYCNFAKGKLSIEEFGQWIKRIQEYQKKKS